MVDDDQRYEGESEGARILDELATRSSELRRVLHRAEFARNRAVLEQAVEADAGFLETLRHVRVEASEFLDDLHVVIPDEGSWGQFLDRPAKSLGLNVRGRPYDFDWTARQDHGSPNADKGEGTMELSVSSGSTPDAEHTWNGAGIGIRFTPGASVGMLRVAPFLPYGYRWHDDSTLEVARNRGELGVLIREIGGATLVDNRVKLWNDGTGWYEEHNDDQDGVFNDSTFLFVNAGRELEIWFWFNSSIDFNHQTSGFLDFGSSRASNFLGARLGFIVIEQFTI